MRVYLPDLPDFLNRGGRFSRLESIAIRDSSFSESLPSELIRDTNVTTSHPKVGRVRAIDFLPPFALDCSADVSTLSGVLLSTTPFSLIWLKVLDVGRPEIFLRRIFRLLARVALLFSSCGLIGADIARTSGVRRSTVKDKALTTEKAGFPTVPRLAWNWARRADAEGWKRCDWSTGFSFESFNSCSKRFCTSPVWKFTFK